MMKNTTLLVFLITVYVICSAKSCEQVTDSTPTCYGVDFNWLKDQRAISNENGQSMVTLQSSLWLTVEENVSQEAIFTITGAELISYDQKLASQIDMEAQTIRVFYPGVQTTNKKQLLLGDMVVKYPYSSDGSLLPKMSVVYTANLHGNFTGCTFEAKPPVNAINNYRSRTEVFALTEAEL